MKKVLLATTALVLTGGAALAEVTFTGSGRMGVVYEEDTTDTPGVTETFINTRLRFNINAQTETTSGITFGGRIRLQYDNGDNNLSGVQGGAVVGEGGAELSAAKLFGEMNGFRVEVGNVDTAYDSSALMYNSEIGFIGQSFGNPGGDFYSFSSSPFNDDDVDRMGIAFTYGVENFNVRLSYVDPDQLTEAGVEEIGVSADYTFDQFTLSGAFVMDGNGIDGNDQYFLGAQYALSDIVNVGLLYFDNGEQPFADDNNGDGDTLDVGETGIDEIGNTITLYGNYGMGATTLRGYIANNDDDANVDDLAFGLGADYDLGGATLAGGVERGFDSDVRANLGVKFDF